MGLGPVLDYWRGRAEKPAALVRDWTQSELAQFYRVEWALSQAGISVDTDRGLSDEGDPWFAFCRASDAEVVIHIAREGQTYLLAGFLSDRIQRGRDFGQLVERLLAEHPAKSIDKRGESNVVMHPATLLALLVSIAFLQSNEGKAETSKEHSDDAAPLRAPMSQFGLNVSLRSAATLSGSVVALAATLELAQAMTILRVANLMNEAPADHAETQSDTPDGVGSDHGWVLQAKRGSAPDRDLTDQTQLADTHAASALDTSSVPSPSAQASIEKMLEIVAKLWTFPDTGGATPDGLGVSAALAFFSGASGSLDANFIEARAHQQALVAGETPHAGDLARHVAAADQGDGAGSTLTIVHTPGSSASIAQTILKLNFADQGEVTIKLTTQADTGKLISAVSEIVAHAKTELLSVLDSAGSLAGHSGIEIASVAGPLGTDKASLELKSDGKIVATEPSSAAPVEKAYTTIVADGAIKHDVLNDAGEVAVERAIAAFKEDVGHFAVEIAGRDVIFYSPDAVFNHSPQVVVELWQFKDGSSIALVGLSVDGHLPYSL